jgi:DNA-binding beta-propeller fold protein YncE
MPIAAPAGVRGLASALALALAAALLSIAAPAPAAAQSVPPPSNADHEVWALDQGAGVNEIVIFDSANEVIDRIDFEEELSPDAEGRTIVDTPHMIDFTSDYRYAFVANTRSGNVAVIRTDDREILDVIPTGAVAHFAGVTPDDRSAWVANIGAKTLTEITIDAENEVFEIGRELDLAEDPNYPEAYQGRERAAQPGPVCHQYTNDSRFAYVTLGPSAEGGLVVVDLGGEDGEPFILKSFDPAEVKANCGVGLSADGGTMYANFGSPDPAVDSEWYAFDTATHELTGTFDSFGADAHGLRVTPDGEELWMLNRQTSDLVVFDTATNEPIAEPTFIGESPDILDFSPDGSLAYVTLRGPNPRSGGSAVHPIAGDTPGIAVVDTATREVVTTLTPNDDRVDPAIEGEDQRTSDFHGLAVRHLPVPEGTVTRFSGEGRVATAVAVSAGTFAAGEATGAVLARAGDYPDALAGTPLAVEVGGPVLLTDTEALPPLVAGELQRVLPAGSTVHVLGGEGAVSPAVVASVEELGFTVERLSGTTRFETAVAIAEAIEAPTAQILTTGLDFADALSAGAAAAQVGGVVLLTAGEAPQSATDAYLAEHEVDEVVAVGGPAARAYPEATAITGASRVETAVAVARAFFEDASVVGLARADAFPDALAGGAHIAALGGPLLLSPGDALHPEVSAYVCERADAIDGAFAYGGDAALSNATVLALANRVNGEGCAEGAEVTASATRFAAAPGSPELTCHLPAA